MSRRRAHSNIRRIVGATARLEQQPYDYVPGVRLPRLSSGSTYLCCRLGSTLNAATGTFPSLTPGKILNQQIYEPSQNANTNAFSLAAISDTNSTVLNYTNTSFNTNSTTVVMSSGISNVYCAIVQDC